ncbi:MAG: carboxypeptidase regulatory-like domain-containing protein [Planctomycetes bacterium]|nr:carboxypeptidase regulatory-like domain-containing protein [Planctomycetota bacterium]MBL7007404.1 carboxypeptidase regulatory-like domain-containing protein [Planctomycetota bacterium]
MKLRASAAALLLPVVIVAGSLAIGHRDLDRVEGAEWEPGPDPDAGGFAVPEARETLVRFFDADGAPAAGALVTQLEPSLSSQRTGADGRVSLLSYAEGELRVMAWAEGHEVFGPASFEAPPAAGFHLTRMRHPALPRLEPLVETTRRLRLRRRDDGSPVAGALVLARPATDLEAAPFVVFSDADGDATVAGLPEGAARFDVYVPGFPPAPAWLLASGSGPELELRCADLLLRDLEAGAVLSGERLDQPAPLPSRLVPGSGELLLSPLPPGRYRFRAGDREWEVELEEASG